MSAYPTALEDTPSGDVAPVSKLSETVSPTIAVPAARFEAATVLIRSDVRSTALVANPSESEIPRRANVNRAAASPFQQRFWFLDRLSADPSVYNLAEAIRIRGPLDVVALKKAWQAVVDRQEALRTTFEDESGWPIQIVHSKVSAELPVADLSALPLAEREREIRRLLSESARQHFDVTNLPLWNARLLRISPDESLLAWTFHRVIIDESSRSVVLSDLWQAYGQASQGQPVALSELPARYLEYSLWQRDKISPASLPFWKERLRGIPPLMVPPHPIARPAIRTNEGGTLCFSIEPRIAWELAELSRRAGVSTDITLLAAFQTLLSRWTGQADVCLGSAISVRPSAAQDIAGCFVNTVVLRTNLGENPTFLELLQRTADTLNNARQHGDVPFEKLVEELKPERIPGGNPLFQTLFFYQGENLNGTAPGGLTWNVESTHRAGAKLDFTMAVEDRVGNLQIHFEYSSDLYDEATIQRYSAQMQTLLAGIAAQPEARLSELPILPPEEQEKILLTFNEWTGSSPMDQCVHELVEEQVERTPDAVAFVCRGESLTFRELNERANRLAHHLRSLGVEPETLVGVCVERSLDMAVALLGILKSGGAYLPLDPDFPADRLDFYVRDSQMPIIVAHKHLLERLPAAKDIRNVCIDADSAAIARNPATNPELISQPENLVYVLYTSGSTGKPNGVAIEHRSLSNLLWSFSLEPGLRAGDTILSVTTLSFDIHTVEIWLPMIVGARCVIATADVKVDGHRLSELVKESKITVMQSTPATWRLMIAAGWKGDKQLRSFVGGEALTSELAQQLLERCGEVWNVYGPTETTVWSVIHRVMPQDRAVHIGHPVLNTQIYILDPHHKPVPIGCVGEIWIGGDGLARGYLGRPELTAARFVPDPFADANSGARIYKTGDLGRFHPDGTIECLGRVDHQVKVRGFRIELNEIERVLEQIEGVAQAVVVAKKGDEFSASLHAYYRCEPGHQPKPADLRKFAQGLLPDYMIPATFTVLAEFPQTPNGKVDRKALPDPTIESSARSEEKELVPPGNDAERALLAIWEEVLNIKPISVVDDFHELGGHSLLAAVLMSRIESRLGHRLPIDVLFEKSTVRGLADVITRKLELGSGVMVPLQTGGTQPPLILIAGVGGHVFQFHKFARLLGPDYVAYGMKAIGVDGSEPPLHRFEEIAARYVKEILAACPEGPYLLGGYSVGGRIALEVALQLQALGKHVPTLIIYDMFAPGSPKPAPLLQRIWFHWKRFLAHPGKLAYLKDRFQAIFRRLTGKRKGYIVADGLDVAPRQLLEAIEASLLRGSAEYWPARKFKGQVVLVRSTIEEDWESAVRPELFKGWQNWSTEPVVESLSGADHLHIFEDKYLEENAKLIRKLIQEVADDLSPLESAALVGV